MAKKGNTIWIWVISFMVLIIILLVSYFLYQKINSDKGGDELGIVPDKTPSYGEGSVDANSKSRLKIKFFR
jgi:hypothetical protein